MWTAVRWFRSEHPQRDLGISDMVHLIPADHPSSWEKSQHSCLSVGITSHWPSSEQCGWSRRWGQVTWEMSSQGWFCCYTLNLEDLTCICLMSVLIKRQIPRQCLCPCSATGYTGLTALCGIPWKAAIYAAWIKNRWEQLLGEERF